jgi:PD-(D/E)XK nuclease superfamily
VPDVVLADGEAPSSGDLPRVIVLDAKYRIEEGLPASLNSIHTYRDALVRESSTGKAEGIVSAAYLMAPHMPANLTPGYRDTPLPGRLFHPEYRRSFRFGAVTLRPGMTTADVAAALRSIVADAMAP